MNASTHCDNPVIVIDKLTKKYGEFTALESLSLTLDRGRILGFIGPNGAGKTTTIKILVGLAKPTSGSASIAGVDCVRDARRIRKLIGYMPDKFGSYDNMRVHEYLDFYGAVYDIPFRERSKRIDEVLELVHASYMRDRYVEALSHGMQQRIGLARTILHDPPVLILDEPANGLDPQARIEMREILLRLAAMGKTLIVTSHILPELSRICHQVAIITRGKLRAAGTLEEILRRVNQRRISEIQLATTDGLETTADLVQRFLEPTATVDVSAAECMIRFSSTKAERELGRLLSSIVASGVEVTQFREVAADLEDAFLSVTAVEREPDAASTDELARPPPKKRHFFGGGKTVKNPLVVRELIGLLRSSQALAIEVGLSLLWAILVLVRWPTDAQIALAGTEAQRVFMLLSYGLLASIILLSPVIPASGIVSERQRRTLDLLLISPMSPGAIFFGKFVSSVAGTILILATSIPATVACYGMGGISLMNDVIPLYLILMVVAIQMAALGLYISSCSSTVDAALRMSFGGVLALTILPVAPYLFVRGSAGTFAIWASRLRNLSPIPAVMQLVGHGDVGSRGTIDDTNLLPTYLCLAVITIFAFAAGTIYRLGRALLDKPRSSGKMTDDRSVAVRSLRRVFFLIDPQRRKHGIRPWMNPVMVKEFRCRRFGRLHWLLRLIACCAVVSLILTYAATLGAIGWNAESIGGILVVLQGLLIVLLTPSLASGLISSERESGGWNLMRVTPLSASRIVIGKLLSVAWTLLLILCATLPGYGIMIFIKPALTEQVRQVMICLVLTAVFSAILSAAVSAFFRRTAFATATAYCLLLSLFAGTMLIWAGRDAPFGHSTVETALSFNPLAAALSIIGTPGFTQYQLVPGSWWITGGVSCGLLVILGLQTWRLTLPE